MIRLLVRLSILCSFLVLISYGVTCWESERVAGHRVEQPEAGGPRTEYDVDSAGRVHGKVIHYHANGKVAMIAEFDHGVSVGASEHFDENGEPID